MEQSAPLPYSGTALTDMKGIGPARASRIQQALGIEFAEDLLRFSPEDIHQKLAATGPQVPKVEIQRWLIQALRLVKAQEAQAEANLKPAELTVPTINGAVNPGTVNDSPGESSPRSSGLFQIAWMDGDLHVTYQNGGTPPVQLTTADPQTLYDWLIEQLSSGDRTTNPPHLAETSAAVAPTPHIEVTDIRAIPLAEIDSADSGMPPYVSKGVPFVVRAGFQITSDDPSVLDTSQTALAQFSVRNRLTQDCIALGTAQAAIQGEARVNVQSPPVTLTIPGVYQLQAVVTLPGQEATAGYRELQLMKVL